MKNQRSDLHVSQDINRTLVRQDVKVKSIDYRYANGRVTFKGRLEKRHGKEIEDKDEVKKIEHQLKRIDGVTTVEWDLKNWKKEHGRWQKIDGGDDLREQIREYRGN